MCARKPRLRSQAKSLPQAMREFLTPAVFKQVRKAASRRKQPRWDVHPLLYVLLLSTWCVGDSLPEKFEIARGYYAICCPKRKRPGKSFAGFEKAITRLPMPVLRALSTALRSRILAIFGHRLSCHGFIPLGCDGTQIECPRSEALEQRVGTSGKQGSAPKIWNTSIVHLTLGIPWCWWWGRGGKASERKHLMHMISWLPRRALVVADAGYVGYEVVRKLLEAKVQFLIRMSSNALFYTEQNTRLDRFREGIVFYWPDVIRKQGKPPLRGRLIRITSRDHKDVWLLTNVEDARRLPTEVASQFYRRRWENEGFFRTYKRMLKKVKLSSRTLRGARREAEGSMIATQLLLCQGALAMQVSCTKNETPAMCSPRNVLLEFRRTLRGQRPFGEFGRLLASAKRERRDRRTPKTKRIWPGRKKHKPPNPPRILRLREERKPGVPQNLIVA
jgi:hypothetical protein